MLPIDDVMCLIIDELLLDSFPEIVAVRMLLINKLFSQSFGSYIISAFEPKSALQCAVDERMGLRPTGVVMKQLCRRAGLRVSGNVYILYRRLREVTDKKDVTGFTRYFLICAAKQVQLRKHQLFIKKAYDERAKKIRALQAELALLQPGSEQRSRFLDIMSSKENTMETRLWALDNRLEDNFAEVERISGDFHRLNADIVPPKVERTPPKGAMY
jgi:hypothetical protein